MFEQAKGFEPNKPGVTPGVKDNPSMILMDRCQIMKENPPGDDWDGVDVMTSKQVKDFDLLLEESWFVSFFPLNVATNTWDLLLRRWQAFLKVFDGLLKV